MRNLEWLTPEVLARINQIRSRANLPEFTMEGFITILQNCDEVKYRIIKEYFS